MRCLLVALVFCCYLAVCDSRNPCDYCEYCDFCSLCEDKCPCSDNANCEFCKYCTYCPLCSLCDQACSDDSYVKGAMGWIDSWKNIALSTLGISEDQLPDLNQVDNELLSLDKYLSNINHEKENLELRRKLVKLADDISKLNQEEFGAVLKLVRSNRPEWWGQDKITVRKDLVDHTHDEL